MFEDKMGFDQHLLWDDPDIREGILHWRNRVFGFYGEYGECVDIQVIKDQLALNEKTFEYIYSEEFTPLSLHYEPGSRPFLEKELSKIIEDDMSEKEKFIAIIRRCRDNRDAANPDLNFLGGTEEEMMKRGYTICNEVSRIFVVLCQIAGLQARLVSVHIAGHMMAEAYVDGKWAWCDPSLGNYMYLDDGRFASWWELMQDPEIVNQQDRSVWDDCRPGSGEMVVGAIQLKTAEDSELRIHYLIETQARLRDCFLHPASGAAMGNYYVWDFSKYDYPPFYIN